MCLELDFNQIVKSDGGLQVKQQAYERATSMRAGDIMTEDVICVDQSASVFDATELMLSAGVSAVPVVDTQNRIVGIISEADLMRRGEIWHNRQRILAVAAGRGQGYGGARVRSRPFATHQ